MVTGGTIPTLLIWLSIYIRFDIVHTYIVFESLELVDFLLASENPRDTRVGPSRCLEARFIRNKG